MWRGDISTQLAYLRGPRTPRVREQMMWDMMDRPAWLHRLLAHMRDGILRTHEEAEAAGDWSRQRWRWQRPPEPGYALRGGAG